MEIRIACPAHIKKGTLIGTTSSHLSNARLLSYNLFLHFDFCLSSPVLCVAVCMSLGKISRFISHLLLLSSPLFVAEKRLKTRTCASAGFLYHSHCVRHSFCFSGKKCGASISVSLLFFPFFHSNLCDCDICENE